MQLIRQAILIVAIGVSAIACPAQMLDSDNDAGTAAMDRGPLVVWVVTPGTAADKLRIAAENAYKRAAAGAVPPGYKEQTAGSFGKPSSEHGQTAGSYGTTSGSFGTSSSDVGQTAGSYGQTAGSAGTNAGDFGQNAGNFGQTAGSFGQTSSTFGQSLSGMSLASPPPAPVSVPARNALRDALSSDVGRAFPDMQVQAVVVVAEEFKDKLAAAEGSAKYPDVVMIAALPAWWYGDSVGVAMLGTRNFLEVADSRDGPAWQALQAAIPIRAAHPAQARTFVLWLRDQSGCGVCRFPNLDKSLQYPANVAANALGYVLQGNGLGELADAEAAKFSGPWAQRLALAAPASNVSLDELEYRMDVTDAAANDRLAVVSLRAIGSAPQAFGVLYARVILRKDDAGRWKVLQISPNVSSGSRLNVLKTFTAAVTPAKVTGVSLAAPIDGDNRPPLPDLWWDNGGGAGLLIVEWQINLGGWTDSRLMFVPDQDPRVQTRVNASFARMRGEYRWRVWAVGKGGAMRLSPWRTLNIVR